MDTTAYVKRLEAAQRCSDARHTKTRLLLSAWIVGPTGAHWSIATQGAVSQMYAMPLESACPTCFQTAMES
jgi:hypothetical protein